MADYVFNIGDTVRRGWEIRDPDGVLANATAVTVTIVQPDGTEVEPAPTNPSAGLYEVDFTPTMEGLHTLIWTATGTNSGSDVDSFYVRSRIPAMVSMFEAKAHLNWSPNATDEDEDELVRFLDAASNACEQYTNRIWRRQTFTEVHDGGTSCLFLSYSPVTSITSVKESGVTLDPSAYTFSITGMVWRLAAEYTRMSFAVGFRNIEVEYVTGSSLIPADVRQGVLEMVRHLFESQRGATRMPMSQGGDEYAWIQGATYAVPRRVAELWEPYKYRNGLA